MDSRPQAITTALLRETLRKLESESNSPEIEKLKKNILRVLADLENRDSHKATAG